MRELFRKIRLYRKFMLTKHGSKKRYSHFFFVMIFKKSKYPLEPFFLVIICSFKHSTIQKKYIRFMGSILLRVIYHQRPPPAINLIYLPSTNIVCKLQLDHIYVVHSIDVSVSRTDLIDLDDLVRLTD